MARAAFPGDEVVLDDHARTIDLLRDHPEWQDAWFVLGADEFADFLSWKEPNEVLARVRLAVGTRPGFPPERLEAVLDGARAAGARAAVRDGAGAGGVARPPARSSSRPTSRLRSRRSSAARGCTGRHPGYTEAS